MFNAKSITTIMKTRYIVLLALAIAFAACNRDEESLFDKSAAERTAEALDNAFDVLTSAENGWEMIYFANQANAGYTVLLKFDKHGQVIAASRNPQTTKNVYKEDNNSTWTLLADYGPMLSFDTYNTVMHAWADPQTDGDGYLGDYEFLILKATPDTVRLKGKKHEAYCEMYPLGKDVSWTGYFDEVYKLRDLVVTKNNGAEFNFVTGGKTRRMSYSDGIMIQDLENGIIYPFAVRPNVISFYNTGLDADGGNAINFRVNDTQTALECVDQGVTARFDPALTIAEILNAKLDRHIEWTVDKNDMGSSTKTTYNTIANAVKSSGGSLISIKIQRIDSTAVDEEEEEYQYPVDRLNIEFNGSNGRTQAFFIMDFKLNETNLTYNYKYYSEEEKAAAAALEFLQRAGGGTGKEAVGLKRLKELITGTFTVSSASGSTLNAQELYLTGTNDSNKRLKITAK